MNLLAALEVTTSEELDPTRPLKLGFLDLGLDATAEAIRILAGGDFPREVLSSPRSFALPVYWAVSHRVEGDAEVFGFPAGVTAGLPTAIEVALVRAIAASQPEDHVTILAGGNEIALGPSLACADFRKVLAVVNQPIAGESILTQGFSQAIINKDISKLLSKAALNCLASSFRTSPLKFRYLELYRVMEARFLADVKDKLFSNFDAEPNAALGEAVDALKSEMKQILGLAETQQDVFEACWTVIDSIKNTNRFAAALFRRLEKKGSGSGTKWKTGAALVYQVRCAIVHAGEKDLIFDNFDDGEDVLEAVLPFVEQAALLLVGIQLA